MLRVPDVRVIAAGGLRTEPKLMYDQLPLTNVRIPRVYDWLLKSTVPFVRVNLPAAV